MKPWDQKPLWWLVYMSDDRVYLEAARIIGYLGCGPTEFYDAAKALKNYDKYKFECAVRDLTVYAKRQPPVLRLELTPLARKLCRVILGAPPEDPDYEGWWALRLISNPDAVPPVPLGCKQPPPKKKPTAARKKRGEVKG